MRLLIIVAAAGFVSVCTGCGEDEISVGGFQSSDKDQITACSDPPLFSQGETIRIYTGDQKNPAVIQTRITLDRRFGIPEDSIEILGAADTWEKITAGTDAGFETVLWQRGKTPEPVENIIKRGFLPWVHRNLGFITVFGFALLMSAAFIGVTGGPTKGQVPFIVSFIHLTAFLFIKSPWTSWAFFAYLGLLAVLLGVSLYAMNASEDKRRHIISLISILTLYIAMFSIIVLKDYKPYAVWNTSEVIQSYVPEHMGGRIELLDDNRNQLKEYNLSENITARKLIVYTSAEPVPRILRATAPDGTRTEIPLPPRPEQKKAIKVQSTPEKSPDKEGSRESTSEGSITKTVKWLKLKAGQSIVNKILIIIGLIVGGFIGLILLGIILIIPGEIMDEIKFSIERRKGKKKSE